MISDSIKAANDLASIVPLLGAARPAKITKRHLNSLNIFWNMIRTARWLIC
jgi:hypothetical protein